MNCSLINQPSAMDIAIHTGYSGSYFTQLLQVSGFRTWTVKKAYVATFLVGIFHLPLSRSYLTSLEKASPTQT